MSRPFLPPIVLLSALMLITTACADEPAGEIRPAPLLVFAASSLTDAFADIEEAFEEANPQYDVGISYAASSQLREQILEGAPADVYASANPGNMAQVEAAGETVGAPVPFARNEMQIAVPAGNPAGVTGLEEFADPDLLIGMCDEQLPCGIFGREVLASAGIEASVDTNELSVRFLLTKVEAGELDAGLVYVTDVVSTDRVEGIDIPPEWNAEAVYPIAVLSSSADPAGATAFVSFVTSPAGMAILAAHGFKAP